MKISAVIIARKGSRRLPNKLYRKFHGVSLIEHKIKQLCKTNVDEIIVGSDDEKISNICKKYKKKKIFFFKREKKFCDETSTTPNQMISNMLGFFKTDIVVWAHITNPLTNNEHYNQAIETFLKNKKKGFDSLHSVSIMKRFFWANNGKAMNHNPLEKSHTLLSSKKIKPYYVANGAIFIRYHKEMIKDGRFWGKRRLMYKMNFVDGWDIDTEWQLDACQLKSFKT